MALWQCKAKWSNGAETIAIGTTQAEAEQKLNHEVLTDVNNNGINTVVGRSCLLLISDNPQPNEWLAKFFQHGDLSGNVFEIRGLGKENGIRELTFPYENEISSAIVKPGFRARCFNQANFRGRQLRLDKDPQQGRANFIPGPNGEMHFTSFPSNNNDSITSIYIEAI